MMPYWSYMMEKSLLYLGLGLGFLGAYLIRPTAAGGTDRFPKSTAIPLGGLLALAVLLLFPPLLLLALIVLMLVAYWQRAVTGGPWIAPKDDEARAPSQGR
jgi:ABC-type branched-subunit amino acid transport system permease subunit